jgi:hypothetical protein
MKRLLKTPWIICVVLFSFTMLSACASTPSVQTKEGETSVPGQYKNETYRFTAEYPENYKPKPLKGADVFRVAQPNMWGLPVFHIAVKDAVENLDGAKYIEFVKKDNPGSKNFDLLSEKMVTLNDGTPALLISWKWTYSDGATKLQSASLAAQKDGKRISVSSTTVQGTDTTPEMLLGVVSTLNFY